MSRRRYGMTTYCIWCDAYYTMSLSLPNLKQIYQKDMATVAKNGRFLVATTLRQGILFIIFSLSIDIKRLPPKN